ncbi:MAG: hypothetical protein COW00_12040 [Bdellovibrio sp. CG12_big_fil_rev_8_21_14_0_65_39_13]|nr:MAG: hypothetical protein COW78_16170 [Bdellovibrio sp. CG22_combo_CG10-13_8_21_14_all_39_27]PIQ59109.1 MAG: hypothetical protein COW00_12040 [Bdellovibrio sp. CG12_big_fil_rev_8_21_14_0_65_39_13]PIR33677.1 MAG: hypothetical protein COV37_15435 [Bdellovibrio sp. CG11_big_fil_rev_8_21_14_0_20_39_38]
MLNALRYTRVLENAGFTEEQAKAAVDCWMEFMSAEFATKGDLKELEYTMRSSMKDIELKLDKRCDQLEQKIDYLAKDFSSFQLNVEQKFIDIESKLTIKLGGIMVVGIGFLAALIKL